MSIASIVAWWKRLMCDHFWRPARVDSKKHFGYTEYSQPFKVCDYCGKRVALDLDRFYAEFGRMPF